MQTRNEQQQVALYSLEPDEIVGNPHFRVYQYEGNLPAASDLLIPHRKDHYLVVFLRQAGGTRQWIDMQPFIQMPWWVMTQTGMMVSSFFLPTHTIHW